MNVRVIRCTRTLLALLTLAVLALAAIVAVGAVVWQTQQEGAQVDVERGYEDNEHLNSGVQSKSTTDKEVECPSLDCPCFVTPLSQETCLTSDCVTAASAIIESIDRSVNPCDDFYGFVCNGWTERHQIPKGQSSWSVTDQRSEDNLQILRTLLERPLTHRQHKKDVPFMFLN